MLNCKHIGPIIELTLGREARNIHYPSPFYYFSPLNDSIVEISDIIRARAPIRIERAVTS